MSKTILFLIIIFLLIVIQSSFYPYLKINNAFPNLILITILIFSILQKQKEALTWIVFGGLCLDIFSFNNPLGLSIIGLFLVSYLAFFLKQNIFQKINFGSISLIGASGILIYKLFIILSLKLIGTNVHFGLGQLATEVIYNLVFLIPLFYLLNRFLRKKRAAIF